MNKTVSIPIIVCQQCSGTAVAVAAYLQQHGAMKRALLLKELGISMKAIDKALLDLSLIDAVKLNGNNELIVVNNQQELQAIPIHYVDMFFNKCLSSSEMKVLCAVYALNEKGTVPTLKTVSKFTGMDASGVSKALKFLARNRIIKSTVHEDAAHYSYSV